jgi:hypothetical protein
VCRINGLRVSVVKYHGIFIVGRRDLVQRIILKLISGYTVKMWTGCKLLWIYCVNEFDEHDFRFSRLVNIGNVMIARVITSFPAT